MRFAAPWCVSLPWNLLILLVGALCCTSVPQELHIDRNILRKGRDGKPVARSTQNKLLILFRMIRRGISLADALKAMEVKQVVEIL